MRPLEGVTVLEFAQYMAGPSAGLRLADLGARVIKIEHPNRGEGGRQLAMKNLFVDGDSLVFHTINRNKESFAADLKNPDNLAVIKRLIARADVMTHNFRPGVMERLGLDWDAVSKLNPRMVYGEVTGYGAEGPWKNKPGQDLLLQSVSGLTWLSGNAEQGPVPMGLAVVDILCGSHLVQGILASLIRRAKTGKGAYVQVSLLESSVDFQFEVITTHLADDGRLPQRSKHSNAHAYLAAPYGIYRTQDGYLALAMGDLMEVARLIGCKALEIYRESSTWFTCRDEIQQILSDHLQARPTGYWLGILQEADVWCSDVFDYARLIAHQAWSVLGMAQTVARGDAKIHTTRCPIRIDSQILLSPKAAPKLGQDNGQITMELKNA